MHPLSNVIYFARNKRRALPVMGMIALAVFGVSLSAVLTGSMIEDARRTWLVPLEHFSEVVATNKPLAESRLRQIKGHPGVRRAVSIVSQSIRSQGLFGSTGREVYGLRPIDMHVVMERLGIRLLLGRLPIEGEREIALHDQIVRAKGLRLGSEVGKEVDEDEWLRGRYRLVGTFDGPVPVGITTYRDMLSNSLLNALQRSGEWHLLVFAKDGAAATVGHFLQDLPRSEVIVYTHSRQLAEFRKEMANLDVIIWVINAVVITVLSLAMGLLNTIYFMQRMGEYGILAAIGYRPGVLVKRTLFEVLSLTAVSWGLGLILSQGIYRLIQDRLFAPNGVLLTGLDLRAVLFTLPIPVMIGLFSVVTVLWQLWRLDPVSIIERRE